MTQIEQIKAEIERLKSETCIGISEYDKGVENGRMEVLNTLLKLIDGQKRQDEHADNTHDDNGELPIECDEQEYHKIGETFEFEGHKLTTIGCKGNDIYTCINICFFRNSGRCDLLACCMSERIDRNSVYFSEVDEEGGDE